MADADHGSGFGAGDHPEAASGKEWISTLIWLAGLLSTIYLVGWASFLLFLSIAFMNYSTTNFEWWKAAGIVQDSTPLCCFVAIGIAGLRSWPHGRFRLWGLSAIVFHTALATWLIANPAHFDVFTRLPF